MSAITCPNCGRKYEAMILLGPHEDDDELPPAPPPDTVDGALFTPKPWPDTAHPDARPQDSANPESVKRWGDWSGKYGTTKRWGDWSGKYGTTGLGELVMRRLMSRELTPDEFEMLLAAVNSDERGRDARTSGTLLQRLRAHEYNDDWFAAVLKLVYQ